MQLVELSFRHALFSRFYTPCLLITRYVFTTPDLSIKRPHKDSPWQTPFLT